MFQHQGLLYLFFLLLLILLFVGKRVKGPEALGKLVD